MKYRDIDTAYPFVAFQDLEESVHRIAPNIDPAVVGALEDELFALEKKYAPDNATFYELRFSDIAEGVNELVRQYIVLKQHTKVGVVCLDKDLLETFEGDLFRLSFSRSPFGELTSRRGESRSPEEQRRLLQQWLTEGDHDSVAIVDDVLAFGETAKSIVATIREVCPDLELQYIVGAMSHGGLWQGEEQVTELTTRTPMAMWRIAASPEVEGGSMGMAIPTSRDLTLLGGKVSRDSEGVCYEYPYFYPFSKPLQSIIRAGTEIEASEELLKFNEKLFEVIGQERGREVVMRELGMYACGYPATSLKEYMPLLAEIPHDDDIKVTEYLQRIAAIGLSLAKNGR